MSYSFSTHKGTAASATIPTDTPVAGYTLTVEFSRRRNFSSPHLTKSVTGTGQAVSLSLSAAEVDTVGDAYYRVQGVKSGSTLTLQSGVVDYSTTAAGSSGSSSVTVTNAVQISGQDKGGSNKAISVDSAGRQKISHAQPDAVSGDLVAVNDSLIIDMDGFSDAQVYTKGAAHAGYNLTFEYSPNSTRAAGYAAAGATVDGDWYPVLAKSLASATYIPSTTTGVLTTNALTSFELSVPGAAKLRVRVNARTSGTLTVLGVVSTAARPVSLGAIITNTPSVNLGSGGTGATSLGKAEDAVHTSGDTGVAVWGVRAPASPAAFTSAAGDYSPILTDAEGKLVVASAAADPANTVQQVTDLTTTTNVAIVAAGAAGIRNYVTDLTFDNTGAAAARVTVDDGTTRIFTATVPAGQTFTKFFETPLRGTAATAVNARLGVAGTVTVSAQGYRGI